ncbi:MAG: GNAT family N-acetyltransferase [Proteobacteria bacterium]|nr:MAG: GNAT family N-acetyltransferase [Pseudomonadota bacterium]
MKFYLLLLAQSLRSKRRKEMLREQQQVELQGVRVEVITGAQIKAQHALVMHNFYINTIEKMGGQDYLTNDFFTHVFSSMAKKIVLVLAYDSDDRVVAGALNFVGKSALYGRYWGCIDQYKALHFEVCYYQGIKYCIENKLELFEAGAQGEHKFQRGFLPSLTYSAHAIRHPALSEAIKNFTVREQKHISSMFQEYAEHTPFSRKDLNPT